MGANYRLKFRHLLGFVHFLAGQKFLYKIVIAYKNRIDVTPMVSGLSFLLKQETRILKPEIITLRWLLVHKKNFNL